MRRKPKRASSPIDIEQEAEISESQKRHYAKLGYKPYISHTGKIKWLSADQHIYEQIKYSPQKRFKLFHSKKKQKNNLIRNSRVWLRALVDNWLFILILLGIILLLVKIDYIMNLLTDM